jgi:hypothetical protein
VRSTASSAESQRRTVRPASSSRAHIDGTDASPLPPSPCAAVVVGAARSDRESDDHGTVVSAAAGRLKPKTSDRPPRMCVQNKKRKEAPHCARPHTRAQGSLSGLAQPFSLSLSPPSHARLPTKRRPPHATRTSWRV